MGLLNMFKKGRKDEQQDELNAFENGLAGDLGDGIVGEVEHGGPVDNVEESVPQCSFVMGVLDIQSVAGTDNLVVSGKIKGNVQAGMVISLVNFGDDNREVVMAAVQGIQLEEGPVEYAADCSASLILEEGAGKNIKIGTILFTNDIGESAIHDAYVSALGEAYVRNRILDFSDDEIDNLSITDCSEIWRLNNWYVSHAGRDEEEEIKADRKNRLDKLVTALCHKIMEADEIYYVHDKRTGEAHLFSQTIKRDDGSYICTPPNIMIVSRAYRRHYKKLYSNDKLELAVVRNGSDKNGIGNFLAGNFYINGACGAAINAVQVSISAGMLVEKPDHEGIPVENIPVTNPDLVKWMLLIGQMDTPKENEESELDFKLYYKFMGIEMMKAKFIIPMRHDDPSDENNQDGNPGIATMKGKGDKDAVIMYTDWRRLRSEYGKEWDGMVHRMKGLIEMFDCAINPTRFPAAGSYVTEKMYKSMVGMAKADGKRS